MKKGEAYPIELRERVIGAMERNKWTIEKTAEFFQIGYATVNRWCRLKRETGAVLRRPRGPGHPSVLDVEKRKFIGKLVEEKSDRTIAELTQLFCEREKVNISASTIGRAIRKQGLTLKKKSFPPSKETKSTFKSGKQFT